MTPVNKCLNKVVKLKLCVFKPITCYASEKYLQFQNRTFYQSAVTFRNLRIFDFNLILKIVFETSVHESPIVSYWTTTKKNSKYNLYNIVVSPNFYAILG